MVREKNKKQLLIFISVVFAFGLFLVMLEPAVAQQELQEAHEIGEVYARIHYNMAILSGVITNCENLSDPQGEFFRDYKKRLYDVDSLVGGLIKGVQSLLTKKRFGKDTAAQMEQLLLQLMTFVNIVINQWFNSTDLANRPNACKNFENSIRRGDWDIFPFVDQYFEILKKYDAGIYAESRLARELIEKKRTLYKSHEEK